MIVEITQDSWIDLGQIMTLHATPHSMEGETVVSYMVHFSTSISSHSYKRELMSHEWAKLYTVWTDHVEFMNDQEYKAKQRIIAEEAMHAQHAKALTTMGPFNVSECTDGESIVNLGDEGKAVCEPKDCDPCGPVPCAQEPMVIGEVGPNGETSFTQPFPDPNMTESGPMVMQDPQFGEDGKLL